MSILSNLHVRANLLSEKHYQQEMLTCSVFELRDIKQRNPNLIGSFSPVKLAEWRANLSDGDSPPPPISPAWVEQFAGGLLRDIQRLEERPTREAAFECLMAARLLYHQSPDGPAKIAAAEWDLRICSVLARDEFRHTFDMIDQRLESILGYQLSAPPRPEVVHSEPPVQNTRPVMRPRQPTLFPPASVASERTPIATSALLASSPTLDTSPVEALPVTMESAVPRPVSEAEPPRSVPSPTTGPTPIDPAPTPPAARPTTTLTVRDPDLKRLVQQWAILPDHVKKCIVTLLDAVQATKNTINE